MSTYTKIEELKNKENKAVVQVLKYIAKKEGYMNGEDIEYRRLYYYFLRNKFLKTAHNNPVNGFYVSYRQYKRLRIYRKGKFPIHTAVYLLTLYEIMYGYKKRADLGIVKDDISYTTYIVNDLKKEIENILILPGVSPVLLTRLTQISSDFGILDNKTGRNSKKIYNNIW